MESLWRAKELGMYFSIVGLKTVVAYVEKGHATDKMLYFSGNYFKTREQAEQALYLIQKTLEEFHQNNKNNP